MSEAKSEFRNTTGYVVGVILYNQEGKAIGGAVKPHETIWLSEKERIATANAPKNDQDNPLANGALVLVTEAQQIANRRPIGPDKVEAPAEEPQEAAVEGSSAPDEEVATPQAKPLTNAEIAAQRAVETPTPRDRTPKKAAKKAAPKGKKAPAEEVATPVAEG